MAALLGRLAPLLVVLLALIAGRSAAVSAARKPPPPSKRSPLAGARRSPPPLQPRPRLSAQPPPPRRPSSPPRRPPPRSHPKPPPLRPPPPPRLPTIWGQWESMVCSEDGMRLVASAYALRNTNISQLLPPVYDVNGSLFTSSDGGRTWSKATSAGERRWGPLAMSADGHRVYAAVAGGPSYFAASSDGGGSWQGLPQPGGVGGVPYVGALAVSSNGTRLVAAAGDRIYVSHNYGTSWNVTSAGTRAWDDVASSSAGATLAAASIWSYAGELFISSDGGASWQPRSPPQGERGYRFVALAGDGATMAALGSNDNAAIYTSPDGSSWARLPGVQSTWWGALALSRDGSTLVAAEAYSGRIFVAKAPFAAVHLTVQPAGPRTSWAALAVSGNGTRIAAAAAAGGIWVSADGGASWDPS